MIARFLCLLPDWLFWFHKPEIIQTFDEHTRKLRCVVCGRYFAMSDRHGAVLPWDDDCERMYCDIYGLPRTYR